MGWQAALAPNYMQHTGVIGDRRRHARRRANNFMNLEMLQNDYGFALAAHYFWPAAAHSHNLPAQPCMPQATVVRTRIASPAIQEASNAGGRHAVRKLRGHTMADVVDLAALDALHAAGQFDQALAGCTKCIQANSQNVECLIRRCRWAIDLSEQKPDAEKLPLIISAEADARSAIEAGPSHFAAFKALAVALGKKSSHVGVGEKVQLSADVKNNILKALELNPKDSASLHILGIWHFNVANLDFFSRTFVKVVYGGMPSASNEEAAKCFKDAIALEDCPPHHTELAKVLLAMSKKEEARAELQRALDLPGTFPADRRAQDAARTLMLQHFK